MPKNITQTDVKSVCVAERLSSLIANLQDVFIPQNLGQTILKGTGSKLQDVKKVDFVFGGNLDEAKKKKKK